MSEGVKKSASNGFEMPLPSGEQQAKVSNAIYKFSFSHVMERIEACRSNIVAEMSS